VIAEGSVPRTAQNSWVELVSALKQTSLCGHGTGLGEFAESVLRHYREEVDACFT
jgi:formate dehydrogenase iron-sulfur subunit